MSKDNIRNFTGQTTSDIPIDNVLNGAKDRLSNSGGMMVIGIEDDNNLYVASSKSDIGEMLILLELTKAHLLEVITNE